MKTQPTRTALKASPFASEGDDLQVEAARYAVLRRLAPCLRHHMVRPLQPIGLIYGVMQHKLSAPEPDLPSVREEADKINEFAKAALEECNDMNSWLAPEPGFLIGVDKGVRECVALLATMLHFCGFQLDNDIDDLPVLVGHDAIRMVLSAALLEMTDSMDGQASLLISAVASADEVTITLQCSQKNEGSPNRYEDGYRKLVWRDVQALARAENVGLAREEDGRVVMRFPVGIADASLES